MCRYLAYCFKWWRASISLVLHWLFDSPEVRFYGIATFGLLLGGFLTPPMGVIDGSVLIAAGILVSLKLISVGAYAIKQGRDVSIQHKETKVSIDGKEDNNDERNPD